MFYCLFSCLFNSSFFQFVVDFICSIAEAMFAFEFPLVLELVGLLGLMLIGLGIWYEVRRMRSSVDWYLESLEQLGLVN